VLRLAADENFDNDIISALLRRVANLDIIRVQDVGLAGADDRTILEWAAEEGRVLLTHDVKTMTGFAYERVRAGLPMPGVVEVRASLSIGRAVENLLLLAECSVDGEWEGRVGFVPY
jgi:hypothetical protein